MVASLKFESSRGTEARNLQDTRIVTLEDTGGSIYTLDITTNDLKVEYTPQGSQKVEKTINGLGAALGKLLTIDGSTHGITVLQEKVSEKAVVDAITASADFTNKVYIKTNPADEVYTQTAVDTELAGKVNVDGSNATDPGVNAMLGKLTGDNVVVKVPDLTTKVNVLGDNATETGVNAMLGTLTGNNVVVKINASNLTDATNQKAFAEAILPAKDGPKSILVEKLGLFLDSADSPYGASQNQAAKDFLAAKGLIPEPLDVATALIANANNKGFQEAVKAVISQNGSKSTIISPNDSIFKSAVQDVMSQEQLNFAVPQDSSAPLSWDF